MAKNGIYDVIKNISNLYSDLLIILTLKLRKWLASNTWQKQNITYNQLRNQLIDLIEAEIIALNLEEIIAQTLMLSLQTNLIEWQLEFKNQNLKELTPKQLEAITLRSRRELKVAYTEIITRAKTVEATMLKNVDPIAKEIIDEITAAKALGVPLADSMSSVENLTNKFDFVDQSNRHWNPQSYIEMVARTTAKKLEAETSKKLTAEINNDFRVIDTQSGSCPICWNLHDNVITMNKRATPKEIKIITEDKFIYFGTFDDAVKTGFYHPNERCIINVYFPGITKKSVNQDEAKNSKNYQDRQMQRYMERTIRQWRMKEAGALTTTEQKKAAQKIREWQKRIREFTKENNLTRFYERERMGFNSKPQISKWSKNFILGKTTYLDKDFIEDIISIK